MDELKAYEILGCSENADLREIKKAYARKVKEVHPEEDPSGFQMVKEAYETLKNSTSSLKETKQEKFYQKEYIEDIFNDIETEKKEKYDYDQAINHAEEKEKFYHQALDLIYSYLNNPDLSLNKYEVFFREKDYQDFLFTDAFMNDLKNLVLKHKIEYEVSNFLIQVYHLKNPVSKTEKQLKKALIRKRKSGFHLFILFFLPTSFLMLVVQVLKYDLKEIPIVIAFLSIQVLMLALFYFKYVQSHSYLKAMLFTIGLGMVTYGVYGTIISMISIAMMEVYVDITVPILIVWFGIFIILCFTILIQKAIESHRSFK